jgi:RHS repeat-associated protein
MTMPGRKYSQPNNNYRYGFNGKENDKDAGEGIQDYGMRIYSERLGRFLSVDPISKKYPELTPYQFASNRPLDGIDLDGLEWFALYKAIMEAVDPDFKNKKDKGRIYGLLRSITADGIGDKIGSSIVEAARNPPPPPSIKDVVINSIGGPAWSIAKGLYYQGKSAFVDGNKQAQGELIGDAMMIGAGGIGGNVEVAGERVAVGELAVAEFENPILNFGVKNPGEFNTIRTTEYNSQNFEFNTAHSYYKEHSLNGVSTKFDPLEISVDAVESSIAKDIDWGIKNGIELPNANSGGKVTPFEGNISLNGQEVKYQAVKVDNTIRVSDYFIKAPSKK